MLLHLLFSLHLPRHLWNFFSTLSHSRLLLATNQPGISLHNWPCKHRSDHSYTLHHSSSHSDYHILNPALALHPSMYLYDKATTPEHAPYSFLCRYQQHSELWPPTHPQLPPLPLPLPPSRHPHCRTRAHAYTCHQVSTTSWAAMERV